MPVSQSQIKTFANDGVVCLRRALPRDWLELLAEGVETVIHSPEPRCAECDIPSASGRFFNGFFASLANGQIRNFIRHSPIKDYARDFAQSENIRFFYDQLLAKSPETGQRTPWHSDRDYFPFGGEQIVSVWVPLDPVTRDTGAMEFIRGSHRTDPADYVERCPEPSSVDQDKGMYVLPDFERYPELYDIVSWDTQPGDILVFHIDMLHSAGGNDSHVRWRRALATRWLGDDVRVRENGRHILQKKEIADFLATMGKTWQGSLDDALFPLL